MKSSIRLFRIAGIDIGIHYSWILIFILVASTLALGYLPQASPHNSTSTYWIVGIIAALLLFASVLIHELAHSLVAKAKGIPVHSITLFIFGGVSNLEEEAEKPKVEFIMAIVGPLSSLILAIIFWIIFILIQPTFSASDFFRFGNWFPQDTIAGASLLYLALINASLAIFNILPGFPLDGGRVLRSIVWGATGNLITATNVAAIVGRIFGWTFIAIGVLNIFGYRILIFGPGLVSGIWIGFIGWFLSSAADSSRQEVTMRQHLSGVKVKDAMVQNQANISPATTVDELVRGVFNNRYNRAVPVCEGNQLVGIVTISDIKGLSQEKWAITSVRDIMTKSPLHTVNPDDDLNRVMKLLGQYDLNQVIVVSNGQCAGLLSRAEIIRYLQLAQELKIKGKND
jgi:Zn-dependent protease/CBS domain-containing protein